MQRLENMKLLMRMSRDGGDEQAMYQKLENKGPYLFVFKSSDNYIFGGYISVNIQENQRRRSLSDPRAFVYVLRGSRASKSFKIHKIKSKEGKDAFYYGGLYLFIFGPGEPDIVILAQLTKTHYCGENWAQNSKYSFPSPEGFESLVTNNRYNFTMDEMEIFHV